MDIDRRTFLAIAAAFPMAGYIQLGKLAEASPDEPLGWHPLTQSLLDRAVAAGTRPTDPANVQRAIARFAEVRGLVRSPVIKWLTEPADAGACLAKMGLDALLGMGTTSFWRLGHRSGSVDDRDLEATIRVVIEAERLVQFAEADRHLMKPKLRAKSDAMAQELSPEDLFLVRAIQAQIGWLETSLAATAVQAIRNVELALCTGHTPPEDEFIKHQLCAFRAWEAGLLATWETPSELICVPREAYTRA